MREICTSGSVGAPPGDRRGYPTAVWLASLSAKEARRRRIELASRERDAVMLLSLGRACKPVRPGKAGPKGVRCDELMKFGSSSSGCEPRPAKGKARPAGSEPCDGRGD